MPNLLKSGAAKLAALMNSQGASPVVYRSGGVDKTVNATFGRTEFEQMDEDGITTMSHSHDFLILASNLDAEPAKKDVIIANNRYYRVLPYGNGKPWTWSDSFNTVYRIHTKDFGDVT